MGGFYREIDANKYKIAMKKIFHWLRWDDGSMAIEFAMLAMPFIYLMLGTIEVGLMFAANSVLDNATIDAARLVRTGQVQQASGQPVDLFKAKLCAKASVMMNCSKLKFEVIEMDKFADFNNYKPTFDKTGNLQSKGFNPGGVNTVNLIRVVYNYPLITPLIADLLADGPNRTRQMISTIVLETEPYDINQVAGSL